MHLSNRHSPWESLWQQDPSRFKSSRKHLQLRSVVIGKVAFNRLVNEKWQPRKHNHESTPKSEKTIDFFIYCFSGFGKVKATKWFAVKFPLNLQKLQWSMGGRGWTLETSVIWVGRFEGWMKERQAGLRRDPGDGVMGFCSIQLNSITGSAPILH